MDGFLGGGWSLGTFDPVESSRSRFLARIERRALLWMLPRDKREVMSLLAVSKSLRLGNANVNDGADEDSVDVPFCSSVVITFKRDLG